FRRRGAGHAGELFVKAEASEFGDIYGLEVIEIPTNVDVARIDEHDEVYRTLKEKSEAIVAQVADCKMRGQPILVGTTSIERSEQLSALMKDRAFIRELGQRLEKIAEELPEKEQQRADYLKDIGGYLQSLARDTKRNEAAIPHQVLNARFHEQEAQIIANAGIPGAVTIATNMAGRGTDIQLGGNIDMKLMDWLEEQKKSDNPPSQDDIDAKREEITATLASDKQKALDAGGLYVIGTERHESRRIDNQLRGRSGRQGDPGHSKFYLSLEDDLMRIFGSDRMDGMLKKLGLQDGEAITHPWINKALEKAQGKVEERNFDMRKQILKYDDVMNDQRKVIFDQRIDIMEHDDVSETVTDMRHLVIGEMVSKYIPENAYAEQWDTAGLKQSVEDVFGLDLPIADWANEEGIADEELTERLTKEVDKKAAVKAADFGPDMMRNIEKMVLLQTLDHLWREHLVTLEHLRQVIGFRSYGQRDPLNEYKSEAFTLFESMLVRLREAVTGQLMHIELAPEDMDEMMQQYDELPQMTAQLIDPLSGHDELAESEDDPLAALRPNGQLLAAGERVHPSEMDPNRPETWGKVSRNALCPCGSGKRYKRCHGKNK
ncbi:MAG: SEC-C metal-binding domain-containing protein, partial [Pseudomonadota bacterium]